MNQVIEIEAECAWCGTSLKTDRCKLLDLNATIVLSVVPCRECMAEEKETTNE